MRQRCVPETPGSNGSSPRYNERMKYLTVEIIPDPEQGGFTARVPDIPAYGEGPSEEEAIADLREGLAAYIEAFGIDDALARVNAPSSLRRLDIELADLVRA
jgi:predicted RNase H-like HicB family nuclease